MSYSVASGDLREAIEKCVDKNYANGEAGRPSPFDEAAADDASDDEPEGKYQVEVLRDDPRDDGLVVVDAKKVEGSWEVTFIREL
ncbi:hypothetical protein [Halomicrococcus sp. SG-WS-1]|uniref:hypothetical protein n=1 Tax=Halomicrococcus sp. SG-WS-1 TaxID=3439057 RepID=UPI003F79A7CA